jgi:hypothetical protein
MDFLRAGEGQGEGVWRTALCDRRVMCWVSGLRPLPPVMLVACAPLSELAVLRFTCSSRHAPSPHTKSSRRRHVASCEIRSSRGVSHAVSVGHERFKALRNPLHLSHVDSGHRGTALEIVSTV